MFGIRCGNSSRTRSRLSKRGQGELVSKPLVILALAMIVGGSSTYFMVEHIDGGQQATDTLLAGDYGSEASSALTTHLGEVREGTGGGEQGAGFGWSPVPEDQQAALGLGFYYDVDATGSSGIVYSIDDTTNFQIDPATGEITNKIALSAADYPLTITATDELTNTIEASITISIVGDITPPTWSPTPEDQTISADSGLSYDVNAIDDFPPIAYSIDDTTNFQINPSTGLITDKGTLVAGNTYSLEITAEDSSGNPTTIQIDIDVVADTTPPTWSPVPQDQEVQFGSDFYYDVNAIDDFPPITYSIDDTTNFQIDSATGEITNKISLPLGDYPLLITAEDSSGNPTTTPIIITVTESSPPPGACLDTCVAARQVMGTSMVGRGSISLGSDGHLNTVWAQDDGTLYYAKIDNCDAPGDFLHLLPLDDGSGPITITPNLDTFGIVGDSSNNLHLVVKQYTSTDLDYYLLTTQGHIITEIEKVELMKNKPIDLGGSSIRELKIDEMDSVHALLLKDEAGGLRRQVHTRFEPTLALFSLLFDWNDADGESGTLDQPQYWLDASSDAGLVLGPAGDIRIAYSQIASGEHTMTLLYEDTGVLEESSWTEKSVTYDSTQPKRRVSAGMDAANNYFIAWDALEDGVPTGQVFINKFSGASSFTPLLSAGQRLSQPGTAFQFPELGVAGNSLFVLWEPKVGDGSPGSIEGVRLMTSDLSNHQDQQSFLEMDTTNMVPALPIACEDNGRLHILWQYIDGMPRIQVGCGIEEL